MQVKNFSDWGEANETDKASPQIQGDFVNPVFDDSSVERMPSYSSGKSIDLTKETPIETIAGWGPSYMGNATLGDVQFRCNYLAGLNFYNLVPLAAIDSYTIPSGTNQRAVVSFCKHLKNDTLTALGCRITQTMAVFIDETNKCHILSGSDITKNANFDVDNKTTNDGLRINYNGGDAGYNMTLEVKCMSGKNIFAGEVLTAFTGGAIGGKFNSYTGCKSGQMSALWEWFKNNKWAMFGFFLVAGSLICFMGRTLFTPIVFIVSTTAITALVLLIAYNTFLSDNSKAWVGWVTIGVAVVLGLLVGSLMISFIKLAIFIVSAWGGYAVGLLVYNAFMYKMNSQTGFWCFTLGMALVFGILSLCFWNHILIHATAISGSFMAVYGIGLVAGRYTNPFTLAELIQNHQIEAVDPVFYAYLAGNIVLYFLGVVYQYKQKNGSPDHDPYKYKKYGTRY